MKKEVIMWCCNVNKVGTIKNNKWTCNSKVVEDLEILVDAKFKAKVKELLNL